MEMLNNIDLQELRTNIYFTTQMSTLIISADTVLIHIGSNSTLNSMSNVHRLILKIKKDLVQKRGIYKEN